MSGTARAKVGDMVRITAIAPNADGTHDTQAERLIGKVGRVEYVDSMGAIHGTWGGLALLPVDGYEVVG